MRRHFLCSSNKNGAFVVCSFCVDDPQRIEAYSFSTPCDLFGTRVLINNAKPFDSLTEVPQGTSLRSFKKKGAYALFFQKNDPTENRTLIAGMKSRCPNR